MKPKRRSHHLLLPPRDPEIERLVDEMRRRHDLSLMGIARRAGLHPNTVGNLDRGVTRSPMHRTMSRIWNSLGYELRPVRHRGGED